MFVVVMMLIMAGWSLGEKNASSRCQSQCLLVMIRMLVVVLMWLWWCCIVVVLMMLITAGWGLGGRSVVVGDDEDVGCGFHDADNGAWVRRMLLFNNSFHNDNAMILRWAMF